MGVLRKKNLGVFGDYFSQLFVVFFTSGLATLKMAILVEEGGGCKMSLPRLYQRCPLIKSRIVLIFRKVLFIILKIGILLVIGYLISNYIATLMTTWKMEPQDKVAGIRQDFSQV